ncbi:MAG: hypothetical protein A2Z96_06960 [Spirochaetes bacterium GWB1_48_6]|nr:MAG: hypothetical protein A2Z96_06960 [Spirochaetes bacterium GWB1_48_6]
MVNRHFFSFLLLVILVSGLSALDVNRGKIRLRILDVNGRYSVYYAPDLSNPKYVPLFLAEDPTTSLTTLLIDGTTYPLIPGGNFKLKSEETATGALMTWTSSKVEVLQSFDFLSSPGSAVTDGLRVTYSLKNLTPRNMKCSIKVLIDTNLGEGGTHFILKDGTPVQSELMLSGSEVGGWSSSSPSNPDIGLIFSLDTSATPVSRLIFSNWKRLSEGDWEITPSPGRNFSMLPYSFNDSAVAIYYNNLNLDPGDPIKVVMNLGNSGAVTLEGAKIGTDNVYSDILDLARSSSLEDLLVQLKKDQAVVDDLLNQIDKGLNSIEEFSSGDLEILKAILEELNRRKALYSDR